MRVHARHGLLARFRLSVAIACALITVIVAPCRGASAQGAGVPTPGPIVYSYHDGATKRSHIYVQRPGEAAARKVYDEPGLIPRVKWAPDGEQIAFTNDTLLVMAADGGPVLKVDDPLRWAPYDAFTWGPGDHQITYYAEDADDDGELWIADVGDVENPTRLTSDGGIFAEPAWSPSRDRLAYVWRPGGLQPGRLFVMDADGDAITPLIPGVWPWHISWSPDGRELVYVAWNGLDGSDIFVVEAADGARPRRITAEPYSKHSPVFLDDGSWIAFSVSGDVHVVRADGRDKRALGVRQGPFLISQFDWHSPFRAVSAAGRLPSQWGRIKAPAHEPQTPPVDR